MPAPNASAPDSSSDRRRRYLAVVRGEARGFGPALQRLGLSAAGIPYGVAVRLRNLGYDRGWLRTRRVAGTVVSVGNLTVGGTGKTPFVEHVAGFYRRRDVRVAVLSRGYGAESGPNDEALVLEENLPDVPHLQGKDRVALAQAAIEELESELLVLDDGFQHRRLFRDLDLVLIDATQPWGHGRLLPRGLLREPRTRPAAGASGRPDALRSGRRGGQGQAARGSAAAGARRPGDRDDAPARRPGQRRRRDGAAGGAARPAGGRVLRRRQPGVVPPHPGRLRRRRARRSASTRTTTPTARADVDELRDWARGLPEDCHVVVTQKDLVKLRLSRLADRPLWSLRVRLHVEAGADELERRLEAALGGRR